MPAKIFVEIVNKGSNAYKPNEYGDVIVIERALNPGSNTIRLLRKEYICLCWMICSRTVVSTRKKDVLDMLKFFNIKIDNPLVFMEQTTMKQFIQGDEKEKYEVLMQAMNFKSLEQNFATTDSNLGAMRDMLNRYKEVELSRKRRELAEVEEELDTVRSLKDKEEKLQELKRREIWAEIQERKSFVSSKEEELQDIETTLAEMEKKMENDSHLLEEVKKSSDEKKAQISAIRQEIELQNEQKEQVMREINEYVTPLQEAQIQLQQTQRDFAHVQRIIQANRDSILQLTNRMAKLADDEQKKLQLEQLHKDLKMNQEQLADTSSKIESMEGRKVEIQNSIQTVQSSRETLVHAIREVRETMRSLEAREAELKEISNSLTKYGKSAVAIASRIATMRWESPVFYPVGEYISIQHGYEEWQKAVEVFLHHFPTSAIVNLATPRDREKLLALAEQCGVSNLNIISVDYDGELLLPENRLPQTVQPSILHVLRFAKPVVKKAAIITTGLERCILCHDSNEVMSLTGSGSNRSMPAHVHSIITIEGDVHRVQNGKPSFVANRRKPQGYLSQNQEEALRLIRAQLQEVRLTYSKRNEEDKRYRQEIEKNRALLGEINQNLQQLDAKKSQFFNRMNRIREQLDRIAQEDEEGELASMRMQQQQLEGEISEKEQQANQITQQIESLNEQILSLQRLSDVANQRFVDMQKKVNELESKIALISTVDEVTSRKIELENRIKITEQARLGLKEKQQHLSQEIEERKAELKISIETLGEENRIVERLSRQRCSAEVNLFEANLREEKERMGIRSNEEIKAKYDAISQEYSKIRSEYKAIKREGQEMERLEKRQKIAYDELRNESQQQICKRFTRFLSQRKAEGRVAIDHDNKLVSLSVRMDSTNQIESSQVQNIKVLSGGEKSFVTLSLIMATAHIIESPFFIMDEFDVFMDEANRVISLHSIIETARQENKQFIFITPHNLETVIKEIEKDKDNKDITIFQMKDPQQGRSQ